MAEDDQEARTRAQREAALKEGLALFNLHTRNINKTTRRIHSASSRTHVDSNELQDCLAEYETILEELSTVYDQVCELAFDSPPQKVIDSFERIDAESCKLMSEISLQIRELRSQDSFDHSKSQER